MLFEWDNGEICRLIKSQEQFNVRIDEEVTEL